MKVKPSDCIHLVSNSCLHKKWKQITKIYRHLEFETPKTYIVSIKPSISANNFRRKLTRSNQQPLNLVAGKLSSASPPGSRVVCFFRRRTKINFKICEFIEYLSVKIVLFYIEVRE